MFQQLCAGMQGAQGQHEGEDEDRQGLGGRTDRAVSEARCSEGEINLRTWSSRGLSGGVEARCKTDWRPHLSKSLSRSVGRLSNLLLQRDCLTPYRAEHRPRARHRGGGDRRRGERGHRRWMKQAESQLLRQ